MEFFYLNCVIDRYLASAIVVKTLANSLGWKLKGSPKSNHLYVLACEVPANGNKTIIMPKKYNGYEYLWIVYLGRIIIKKDKIIAGSKIIICLLKGLLNKLPS